MISETIKENLAKRGAQELAKMVQKTFFAGRAFVLADPLVTPITKGIIGDTAVYMVEFLKESILIRIVLTFEKGQWKVTSADITFYLGQEKKSIILAAPFFKSAYWPNGTLPLNV